MEDAIEIKSQELEFGRKRLISALFDVPMMANIMQTELIEEIVKQMAARYVAEHYVEIVKCLSPEAVANMAIAQTGAQLNKTLQEKIPDKILEVISKETEVYQRGLFGNMKRIR